MEDRKTINIPHNGYLSQIHLRKIGTINQADIDAATGLFMKDVDMFEKAIQYFGDGDSDTSDDDLD